ncbi:Plasmodium exported protein, unknown function, partial [Plasmodium berghei]
GPSQPGPSQPGPSQPGPSQPGPSMTNLPFPIPSEDELKQMLKMFEQSMPQGQQKPVPSMPNLPFPIPPIPGMPIPSEDELKQMLKMFGQSMPQGQQKPAPSMPNLPFPIPPIPGMPMPSEDELKQMLKMFGQAMPQENPGSSRRGHGKKPNNMPPMHINQLLPIMNMLGLPNVNTFNKPSSDTKCDCSDCRKNAKTMSKGKKRKRRNLNTSIASNIVKHAVGYIPVILPLIPTLLLMFSGTRFTYVVLYTMSLIKDAYNFIQNKGIF